MKDSAGLYKKYKDFNVDVKINNLTYKDLDAINKIEDQTQQKIAYLNILSLKNKLPMMSILNFDTPPENHKTTVVEVIRMLCSKFSNIGENDVDQIITNFQQVFMSFRWMNLFYHQIVMRGTSSPTEMFPLCKTYVS